MTKLGYYLPWSVGAAAITAIGAGLISTWQPHTGLGKLLGYQVLLGARGAGMQMVGLYSNLVDEIHPLTLHRAWSPSNTTSPPSKPP